MSKDTAEQGGTRSRKRGAPEDRSSSAGYKTVLGLADPDDSSPATDWRDWAAKAAPGTVFDQPEPKELIELTVIVPARNEEDCLGECLKSLVGQSEDIFQLGRDWELIVVDDHSTDRTAEITRGFAGVTLLEAGKLEAGWTGKSNAVWTAARRARGRWLLFTDADTMHEPGDLRRAIHEAQRNKVGHAELFAAAGCARTGAAVADATGFLRAGTGLSAGQGLRSRAANSRGQRSISPRRARSLPAAGRAPQRGRQGAGGRGTGVPGQAPQGGPALPLCRRCCLRAHVPQYAAR